MEEPGDDRDRSRSRSPQTQREQDKEKTGPASRFHISGINRTISEKDLTDFFGKMASSEITDVVLKHHKGFGYIEFERTSQYEEAKLLGKHCINGRNIECKRAKPRDQPQPQNSAPEAKKEDQNSNEQSEGADQVQDKSTCKRYFIGGINSSFSQNDLIEYFRSYGVIIDVLLLFHKGFGYIEFSRISNYDEAKIIGTHLIKGRNLEVKKAKPKGTPSGGGGSHHGGMSLHVSLPPPPVHQAVFNSHHHGGGGRGDHNNQDANSPRYFLGGVTEDIGHHDLKEYFKQFGPLVDVTIIPNKSIGYIQFKKSSDSVEAEREEKLFQAKHKIKDKLVNCSRANPKSGSQDFNFPKGSMPPPFPRHNVHHQQDENNDYNPHFQHEPSPRRFFLGGLNANTSRANLLDYFNKYGDIINLMIFESKNYGYIEFKKTTPEDDAQRESTLIGEVGRSLHTISGVAVTCKKAIPRSQKFNQSGGQFNQGGGQFNQGGGPPPPQQPPPQQHQPPPQEPPEDKNEDYKFKMFVGGLGHLTEEQLQDFFSAMGEVDNILLLKGFGFITFKEIESVEKAISQAKVINGKTMHCISGKYVECKKTFAKPFKKRPASNTLQGPTPPFPAGQGAPPQQTSWNNFNPEAPPFTPNSMQQQQQQPQQQPNQAQAQQFPQGGGAGGFFPQGGAGPYPGNPQGQMQPQGYQQWNNYGMMPQQGYDMNNPMAAQQGYDMNNAQMMGQPGYDPNMMAQQGYGWNNAGMPYMDWNAQYMGQQNYDWNSGTVTYTPYYAGQAIQFPDFITGESSSSMNASEQGSTSAENDNSSASTPTQDSQLTASSNMEERTEEISDNTSSMSIQSVLSKYATSENPQTKTVHSVLSKYSIPTIQTDYSSEEQSQESGDLESSTSHGRRLYENRSSGQQNVNGGEEEEEEWFEGDLADLE